MRLAPLLVALPLVLAHAGQGIDDYAHRRHHARLVARQDNTGSEGVGGGSDVAQTKTPGGGGGGGAATTTQGGGGGGGGSQQIPTQTTQGGTTSSSTSQRPTSSTPTSSSTSQETQTTSTEQTTSSSTSVQETTSSSTEVQTSSSSSSATTKAPSTVVQTSTSAAEETETTRERTNTRNPQTIVSTTRKSATATASGAAKDNEGDKKSGGLPKGALIAIIVCSVVVGVAVIAFTLFRKWKLRPSKNFDQRMQPIDFSPDAGGAMQDDFFEKTMARDADAERQRQQFMTELDKDAGLVGDLQHDFTAGPGGEFGYDADPYYVQHGGDYDFSQHGGDWEYPQHPEPAATGYPPQPGAGAYYSGGAADYPTQDTSDHFAAAPGGAHVPGPAQPFEPFGGADFEVTGRRPTDESAGSSSPYAQAATYRY